MNPAPTPLNRVLSIIVGACVGLTLGPVVFTFVFFSLVLIGVPFGFVMGPILGGLWGNRTPLFRTAFGAFGAWLGLLIFVLGEKYLELPTRAITWFAAPILGLAALFLLPLLAKRLLSEEKREKAAIIAAVVFLAAPMALTPLLVFFPGLLPIDPQQQANESSDQEMAFMMKGDAEAITALGSGYKSYSTRVTDKIAFLRLRVPEICCPGVRAPALKQEVGEGDWKVAIHYLTTANLDSTVRYYEQAFGSRALTPLQSGSGPVIWRVNGKVRGIPISARITNIPHRGVCVVVF